MAERGFTLLELLVATAIFAVVGVMAFGGFNAVLAQRDRTAEELERLKDVQFAMRLIALDLYQIAPRPIRDELGNQQQPALLADERNLYALEFTRSGWSNPGGLPRATLQRVAYRLEEDTLIREYWPVLDRTLSNEPIEIELLTGVKSVEFRFLGEEFSGREWQTQWPPLEMPPQFALRARPLGVEVSLDLEDWGRITRRIETPG
ncbi:MAG: type II secretion system minor pseudopilin GspJ [Gammaproteobacteria bacterium]